MLLEEKHDKVSEKQSFEQYEILIDRSQKYNMKQYEISNFAKGGNVSRHNSSYWTGVEYIGFGPSAHSYYDGKRWHNIADVKKYCEQMGNGEDVSDFEVLGLTDRMNESVMLSLRTIRGLNIKLFELEFGKDNVNSLLKKTLSLNSEHYNINNDYLSLTKSGMFISDSIIVDLIE